MFWLGIGRSVTGAFCGVSPVPAVSSSSVCVGAGRAVAVIIGGDGVGGGAGIVAGVAGGDVVGGCGQWTGAGIVVGVGGDVVVLVVAPVRELDPLSLPSSWLLLHCSVGVVALARRPCLADTIQPSIMPSTSVHRIR